MKLISVNSSHINAVGWESDCMFVEFSNGTQYRYEGVSFAQFEAIKDADSVGIAVRNCGVKGERI